MTVPYSIPNYVDVASFGDGSLRFKWDDWRASQDFLFDGSNFVEKTSNASLRARTALAIGIYQWIIWRFQAALSDQTPFQIAEASWCANVFQGYMRYDELDRKDWLGPVRGPLWAAMTWLQPLVLFSAENPDEMESGLSYLVRLAVHVLPNALPFQNWLERCAQRFIVCYPAATEDPLTSLFGENQENQRGKLVPSEMLDLDFDFKPELAGIQIDRFLRRVDYIGNPFLKTPDALLTEGFQGEPYRLNQHG